MARSFVTFFFGWLWTMVILSLATLAGTLTLGLVSHRLVEFFGPAWGRGCLWFAGIRVRVIGGEHIRERKSRIWIMNHQSLIDMLIMASVCPPGMLAFGKKEFVWIPFVGWAWWSMSQAFIDRRNPERARASIANVARRMAKHARTTVIFPEGTRTRTGQLQPFKTGAFHLALQTKAPVLPVVIYGAFERNPPDTMRVIPGDVTLVIHPERPTDSWTRESLKEHADALHAEYAQWVSQPPP